MASKAKASPATLAALGTAAAVLGIAAPSLALKGKTYEIWIMFEIALGLAAMTRVEARDHKNVRTRIFFARGNPGHIKLRTSTKRDEPCHFQFEGHTHGEYEIHNSVEHLGRSGVEHELDLSIIPSWAAERCRRALSTRPYDYERLVGLELKAYDAMPTLDKELLRAFFGATVDLDISVVLQQLSVRLGTSTSTISYQFPGPQYWFLTTARVTQPSEDFLTSYNINVSAETGPGTVGSFIFDIVDQLTDLP